MPETQTPEEIESQASEMEEMAAKMDALVAQAKQENQDAPEVADEEVSSQTAPLVEEAETVPDESSTAPAPPAGEPLPEMPDSESPTRSAPSLAERLARAPRAELDAAPAEAQAFTPEILETPAPARSASSLSFAERLAARNRPKNEAPLAPAAAPTESTLTQPAAPTVGEPSAEIAPRSFTERLAARTGLDRHLQVPAPENSDSPQDLATHNTELARINEGAELSEREMKNRVLFRQKHLIFDSVIGSIDQRTMAEPDARDHQAADRKRR